jgi:hypothetical protein
VDLLSESSAKQKSFWGGFGVISPLFGRSKWFAMPLAHFDFNTNVFLCYSARFADEWPKQIYHKNEGNSTHIGASSRLQKFN